MANQISFLVLGGSGKLIKQLSFSYKWIAVFLVLLFSGCALCGYGVYDFVRLHRIAENKQDIEQALNRQTSEVAHQRKQIQTFAMEINSLKERLVMLDQLEKKIRIIASLDRPDTHDALFGVGGPAPEDIDTSVDLTRKHSTMLRKMHLQVNQLEGATEAKKESLTDLLSDLERQKNILAHTPTIRPAEGWISSKFGYRISPFTEKREFHKGLDIANRLGTPIIATADGVVTFVGTKGQFGKVVIIDHGHGITTRFAHLDKALMKSGDRVKRGDLIAQMGSTGRSTGPHVHYEVHLNGVPVNPEKYIMN
jgi:murein DD-endopeptidase MepM/ murein hydrolase activator NlpD